jgi:predicted nucleotidyltransferase
MTIAAGLEIPEEALRAVCQRYHVAELSIFGSRARGDASPESDIDLMVEFAPEAGIGLWSFGALEAELSALLGHKVDLVSKRGLKPRIRPRILSEAHVLYAA